MEHFTILNENVHQFPVVIDLSHSGTLVPEDIRSRFLDGTCLSNTDWFLPELYDFLPAMGCTTIINRLSRYVVDMNRSAENTSIGDYRKTVVYQENTQGSPLYSSLLDENEINRRVSLYYDPYHQALEKLLREKLKVYPSVLFMDLHSFFLDFGDGGSQDIYLSNRRGFTSCEQTLHGLHESLTAQGYSVIDNANLGGHIINHYRELFGERIEGVMMELRYTKYIADRYFGEEELTDRNEMLFQSAKQKLKEAFMRLPYFRE
ncbi:MAG: N-formylglutamate amidohydrolase [Clostridium sp.]|uniref:N-formylglutamate amidohydrolase n=1 Tax=Clostridium sp. TaxID=1506 RepID=UPI0029084578|nr:N-formylglutamate amidohydrolase [Clostridium sp.]MDU7336723.1 N-formylglutamate amidohydrolase [Clostridium sp.]